MRCLAGFISLALASTIAPGWSQETDWTDKVTDTPSLVQTDFGPYGSKLPFYGEISCGETAIAMNMLWLARNGFTQLTTDSRDPLVVQAAGENLIQIFQGMLNGAGDSPPEDGSYYRFMISTFLSLKGISPDQVTIDHMLAPTLDWIQQHIEGGSVANVQAGWYSLQGDSLVRDGQHWWTPLAVDTATGVLTINNPYPAAYDNVPNLPSSNPQLIPTITLTPQQQATTDPLLAGGPFLELNTPIVNPTLASQAIMEVAWAFLIDPSAMPSAGHTPADFEITGSRYINVGDGILDASARIKGTGGIQKLGDGQLILHAENISTGANQLSEGTLISTVTGASPLGTGSIAMEYDAALVLQPEGTTPAAITQTLASGANSRLTYGGANSLVLNLGSHLSQAITIGGYTDGTTQNLAQVGKGTFLITPSAGVSALGGLQKVLVAGPAGNRPVNTNGIVSPTIIGVDNDGARSGRFLRYDDVNGFVAADGVFSSDTPIANSTAQTNYIVNTAQTIAAGATADAQVIELRGQDLTGDAGSVLRLGAQTSGTDTGVILNGATLAVPEVSFGASDLYVYTSDQDGTISANLSGSGAVVYHGPGTVTLTEASTYTGETHVAAGTVIAANTTGQATGMGSVFINEDARLQVNSGASTGNVSVGQNGVLTLNGGSVGTLTTSAGLYQSQNGGILEGGGTVRGDANINGTIRAGDTMGTITFEGDMTMNGGFVEWHLNALDATAGNEGILWNSFDFKNTNSHFGTEDDHFFFLLSFANEADPNSGNAFWTENHQWLFAKAPDDGIYYYYELGDTSYNAGSFTLGTVEGGGNDIYVIYNAVPEPSTVLLGVLGGAAVLGVAWRRRARRVA